MAARPARSGRCGPRPICARRAAAWPSRSATGCSSSHRGEWDLAADWTPVWIGFGIELAPRRRAASLVGAPGRCGGRWTPSPSTSASTSAWAAYTGCRGPRTSTAERARFRGNRQVCCPEPGTLSTANLISEGRSAMSRALRKIATASALALVAGLAVTGSGGTATAAAGGFCEGMSAPAEQRRHQPGTRRRQRHRQGDRRHRRRDQGPRQRLRPRRGQALRRERLDPEEGRGVRRVERHRGVLRPGQPLQLHRHLHLRRDRRRPLPHRHGHGEGRAGSSRSARCSSRSWC